MAKTKTAETSVDVNKYVATIANEKRRTDAFALIEIFRSVTGFEPKMWGPTIIGFGKYHYKYESGHEGDAPLAGFAPRKDALVLYMATEFKDREALLSQLGKRKSSKACIYVKKLEDLDVKILRKIVRNSMAHAQKLYPDTATSKAKQR